MRETQLGNRHRITESERICGGFRKPKKNSEAERKERREGQKQRNKAKGRIGILSAWLFVWWVVVEILKRLRERLMGWDY